MHRAALRDGEVEESLRAEVRVRVVQEWILVVHLERLPDAGCDDVLACASTADCPLPFADLAVRATVHSGSSPRSQSS